MLYRGGAPQWHCASLRTLCNIPSRTDAVGGAALVTTKPWSARMVEAAATRLRDLRHEPRARECAQVARSGLPHMGSFLVGR